MEIYFKTLHSSFVYEEMQKFKFHLKKDISFYDGAAQWNTLQLLKINIKKLMT